MESKRKRRYLGSLENNGAYAWTPYGALPIRHASTNIPSPDEIAALLGEE